MSATEPASPAPQAPPASVPFGPVRLVSYMLAGIVLALTQGLGQGFVSVNIPQIAGDLGISVTDASWLMAAYMIPRSSLPLLLIKIRTQFGLRRFTEIGIISYVFVSISAIWVSDLRSAAIIQLLAGITSAPLSTLAFLYILEPLPQQWKMRLGLPMALCVMMLGPSLARVISPALIGDGGLAGIHFTTLGMSMVSLALVYLLPLAPVPRAKVIKPLDLVSFSLISFGFGGFTVAFIMGPIYWWTAMSWIGWLLVASIAALVLTAIIEIHREKPLLDIRWLASPAILHLAGALFLFRLILSEQSAGAPRMFQVLGVAPSQLTLLFAVICIASVLGALACVAWIKPTREAQFHFVALLLIAAGAWMDSHSTIDTRPHQLLISQAMIGFAGTLFLPPALMAGMMAALKKGPEYILSFIIVFLSTQSIGGVIGSGLFTTLINQREALHLQIFAEQMQGTNPLAAAEIAQRAAGLAKQLADPVARQAQAVSLIALDTMNQAFVMAYNDAYFLTFLLSAAAAVALILHVLRDWLAARIEARTAISVTGPQTGRPE